MKPGCDGARPARSGACAASGGNPLAGARTGARLAAACDDPSHAFWPEPISLLEAGLIDWQRILGPRQITDTDLLAQAVRLGGRFVTFDHRVGVEVVAAAEVRHLCVIPAT